MIYGGISKTIIVSDMSTAIPSSALSSQSKVGQWRLIDYTTKDGLCGRLLHVGPETNAPEVAVPLNVSGWHAISIGFWPGHLWVDVCDQYKTKLKLTSDANFVYGSPGPEDSTRNAILQECFWKYACIPSGDMLHIAQQVNGYARSASIAFIRLTPLLEAEIESIKADRATKANRRLIATNDGHGLFFLDCPQTAADIESAIEPLRNSDVGKLFWCLGTGGDAVNYPSRIGEISEPDLSDYLRRGDRYLAESMQELGKQGIDPLKVACDYAHSIGLEFHISMRMGAFAIFPPYDELFTSQTYLQHPEWRCVDKDGTPVVRLSYAFEGVRQRLLELFREAANYGIDGINLIYTRGAPFMLYEQPLLDGFAAEYGKDPRQLDDHDQSWLHYRADVMTDFIVSLRRELDRSGVSQSGKRREISAHVLNNRENNLFHCLDLNKWVREELVDNLIASSWWVEKDWKKGLLDPIDMDYFSGLCRNSGTNWYYNQSNHDCNPEKAMEYTRKAYAAGAAGLALWDHNFRDPLWKWWSVTSRLGHREELAGMDPADNGARHHELESVGGYRMDRYSAYWCY